MAINKYLNIKYSVFSCITNQHVRVVYTIRIEVRTVSILSLHHTLSVDRVVILDQNFPKASCK